MGLNRIAAQGNAAEGRVMSKIEEAVVKLTAQNEALVAEVAAVKAQNDEAAGTLAELKDLLSGVNTDNLADVVSAVADKLGVQIGELKASRDVLDAAEKAADPTPEPDEQPVPVAEPVKQE